MDIIRCRPFDVNVFIRTRRAFMNLKYICRPNLFTSIFLEKQIFVTLLLKLRITKACYHILFTHQKS